MAFIRRPNVLDLINGGLCGDLEDGVFYHAVPTHRVASILKDGLVPRGTDWEGNWDHGMPNLYSRSKVFLAIGWESAFMWRDFLEEQTGDAEITILGVDLPEERWKEVLLDKVAYDEGSICSGYVTFTIPPDLLTVEHN